MKQKSIKKRLMWSMIGISIIPIIALSIFTFTYLSQNLRREFIATNETRVSWAYQYADTVIKQLHDSFYALRLNQTLLSSMNYTPENELQNKRYIIDTLNQTLYSNANIINEIIIYDAESNRLSTLNYRSGGSFITRTPSQTLFKDVIDQPTGMQFISYLGHPYVIHTINKFDDQSFLGGIAFRLNEQISTRFDEILGSDPGGFSIISEETSLMSASLNDLDLTEFITSDETSIVSKTVFHDTYQNQLIFATTTPRHELVIIKTIPVEIFDQALRPIQFITLGIASITLAISVLMSYMIANRISQPISRIVTKMQEAPLALIPFTGDHYDEITQLERGYNEMSEAIRTLIIDKYKKNLELKTAQLKSLQSQMNPHFLNNTFQLIGGMALSMKADQIYEITSSMGEMMKYALNKDEDLLVLKEEIKHLKHYLGIQKQRFGDRVQTEITYDKGLTNYLIPKFTLQPLVENSFKHGFKQIDGAWKILVDIRVLDDIIITIKDNGVGMTKAQANSINEKLKHMDTVLTPDLFSDSTGIGLANIHERIKLLYGSKYGLHIDALNEGGTIITVTIKKMIQSEDSHV